jgi:hypothetical protein
MEWDQHLPPESIALLGMSFGTQDVSEMTTEESSVLYGRLQADLKNAWEEEAM